MPHLARQHSRNASGNICSPRRQSLKRMPHLRQGRHRLPQQPQLPLPGKQNSHLLIDKRSKLVECFEKWANSGLFLFIFVFFATQFKYNI